MAEYTASFGLTAFEYQCGRGVRLGLDKAAALKEAFDAKGITFSVHAPYYISMSSLEEDKRLNSVNYLLQSCALVKACLLYTSRAASSSFWWVASSKKAANSRRRSETSATAYSSWS